MYFYKHDINIMNIDKRLITKTCMKTHQLIIEENLIGTTSGIEHLKAGHLRFEQLRNNLNVKSCLKPIYYV